MIFSMVLFVYLNPHLLVLDSQTPAQIQFCLIALNYLPKLAKPRFWKINRNPLAHSIISTYTYYNLTSYLVCSIENIAKMQFLTLIILHFTPIFWTKYERNQFDYRSQLTVQTPSKGIKHYLFSTIDIQLHHRPQFNVII